MLVGPDGSGKSVLAAKLSKKYNIPIIKKTYAKSKKENDIMFNMYMDMNDKDEIYDRYAHCELAYGLSVRGKTHISTIQLDEIEEKLKQYNTLIIYCTGHIDNLWKRCQDRGEDYIKEKRILASVKQYYDLLFQYRQGGIKVLEYSIENQEEDYNKIENWIKEAEFNEVIK